jgi:hypothetical protein
VAEFGGLRIRRSARNKLSFVFITRVSSANLQRRARDVNEATSYLHFDRRVAGPFAELVNTLDLKSSDIPKDGMALGRLEKFG